MAKKERRSFWKRSPEKRSFIDAISAFFGLNYSSTSTTISTTEAMQLSAVYRCVNVIGDAMGSMPLEIVKFTTNKGQTIDRGHKAFNTLNMSPNLEMSRFTLIKTAISKMLLDGNAFIEIIRDKSGNPKELNLITDTVTIFRKKGGGLLYRISQKSASNSEEFEDRDVDGENMIHLLNYTYDGLVGVSTLVHAAMTTSLAMASEKQAKGFFDGGGNAGGILQTAGKIDKTKADAMKSAWRTAFDTENGTPNGVAVIEAGTTFTPVSINPRDAQMLESRRFNTEEICRFFGVDPSKIGDTSARSYNSVEAGQLAFLTDAIAPIVAKVENEFNRKLFRPSERADTRVRFDTNELIRLDSAAQANSMMKLFQTGAFTTNEIRERIGNQLVDGGDMPFVQVNMQPLSAALITNNEGSQKS
jgi:HK97 family phage portal protein